MPPVAPQQAPSGISGVMARVRHPFVSLTERAVGVTGNRRQVNQAVEIRIVIIVFVAWWSTLLDFPDEREIGCDEERHRQASG